MYVGHLCIIFGEMFKFFDNFWIKFWIKFLLVSCTSYLLLSFSCSVMSDSLQPHGLQHARLPCPSPSPRACSNSCPLSWWCHLTISSSVVPFSSHLQSFPASGFFQMSQRITGQYPIEPYTITPDPTWTSIFHKIIFVVVELLSHVMLLSHGL